MFGLLGILVTVGIMVFLVVQVLDGTGKVSPGVDLGADLHRVAAVNENGGALESDDGKARGAGEARQPDAALPALGQVLAEVRVAGRHQQDLGADGGEFVLHTLDFFMG